METVILTRLPQGGTIGIIAPGFFTDPVRLQKGIEYLNIQGFSVIKGKSLEAKYGYFAGNDELRLNDLHEMFANPKVDAIICARGGWGALRLLDKIDYNLIRRHPKVFVGYSDITTFQLAFWQKCGLPSLSGPMVAVEMANGINDFTAQHFWNQLFNHESHYHFTFSETPVQVWQAGQAQGRLLGGCLSMLAHQSGTAYSPDYSGSILYIEDVGEEPYRIDRYLAQLKLAGVFEQINGLIIGEFSDCEDKNPARNSFTIEEVLREYFADSRYPVIYNFPYGHGAVKVSMPLGVEAVLDTGTGAVSWENMFDRKG